MRLSFADTLGTLALGVLLASCGSERQPAPTEASIGPSDQVVGRDAFAWTEPVWLGPAVNSPARDLNVELSPDGRSLYFGSDRSGGFDIWVSRRAAPGCPWQPAENLGPPVNSAGADAGASFSPDGRTMFFFSDGHGGFGDTDILVTHRSDPRDDGAWAPPVNLGPLVNTPEHESSPEFLQADDGGGMLFFNRGLVPANRLYAVSVTRDGHPRGPAEPVSEFGEGVGTPALRGDGRELIFWMTGTGRADLWVSTRRSINDPWSAPRNLGSPVNTAFAELNPGLSLDGGTLMFSAAQIRGGLGLNDIWMSTRGPFVVETSTDCR